MLCALSAEGRFAVPGRFDEYIHHSNVRNYRRQLAGVVTAEQRKMLLALLADENTRAKSSGWEGSELL